MEKNKVNKKERILEVAENLFAQLGYEGTSTRYLAQEAGVNMAMLNYYFGSKDGLLKAVLNRRVSGMLQALTGIKEQNISSWEKLIQAINFYLDRVLSNNYYHRILHRELSLSQRSETIDLITDNVMQSIAIFKEIIIEGIENGSFRKVDVEMTIASISGINYYMNNSSHIAKRLLQIETNVEGRLETAVIDRIKNFMYENLKAFLLHQ